MRKYSIIHPIVMSFYSQSLYRDVARNWRGFGFWYMFLLIALCWLPIAYQIHQVTAQVIEKETPAWVNQIPQIKIMKGQVTIDKPMPYFIKDPESGKQVVIFDTTGKYTSLNNTVASVLVTKNKIITKNRESETRIYDLSKTEHVQFGPEQVKHALDQVKHYLAAFIYPFAVIFSLIYRLIQALFYAVVGILFAKFFKAKLDYVALLRLAIVAVTPAVIISTLLEFFRINIQYEWLCYFLIAMLYLAYAVYANAKVTDNMVNQVN